MISYKLCFPPQVPIQAAEEGGENVCLFGGSGTGSRGNFSFYFPIHSTKYTQLLRYRCVYLLACIF